MSYEQRRFEKIVLLLDVLSTPLLMFILLGLWLFRDQVFVIGEPLTPAIATMLIGFGAILLFDLASVGWLAGNRHSAPGETETRTRLLVLGVLCLVLFAADKVMIDEVAHETATGWTLQTEYLLLYGMLIFQLAYNVLLARHLLSRSSVT